MARNYKKLELVWRGKGEHVLQNPKTGKWEFCGSDPIPPRPLIEIEALGDERGKSFDPEKSNLLIHGENLFALQSLLPYYAGEIKLIYIDPPFNTGNGFEAYSDNFQHSIWLSMMRERLRLLHKLLRRDDGVVFVQIDFNEVGYLRTLLDEIFGHSNFVSMISWQRSPERTVLGQGAAPIITLVEYILVYSKKATKCKLNRIPKFEVATVKAFQQYNKVLVKEGKRKLVKEIITNDGQPIRIYQHSDFRIESLPLKRLRENPEVFYGLYIANFRRIFRLAAQQKESTIEQLILSHLDNTHLYSVERTPSRGKRSGQLIKSFYFKGNILLFLRDYAKLEGSNILRQSDMNNLWTDISVTGIAKQGGVELKRGKKPEALLQRIIELGSEKGDIVLDCFAGVGTTGAVAQKLQRQWIMMELENAQIKKSLTRLKGVIEGSDRTGISSEVGWQGGGGFRFLQVGAPLLVKDPETNLTILNPRYTNGPLTRAICALEGFLLTGDKILHGRNKNHFAHVTEDFVDSAYAYKVAKKLPNNTSLTIYALRARKNLRLPPRAKVKRMNVGLVKLYLKSKI